MKDTRAMQRQNRRRRGSGSQTSVQDQVQMMSEEFSIDHIEPPEHVTLTHSELIFFYEIIEEFNRKDWTSHQLCLAAFLSREMCSLEKQQRLYRKEGAVLETDRGNLVINPRRSVINMHANSILNFRRSLALHARAISNAYEKAKGLTRSRSVVETQEMLYGGDETNENDSLLPRYNN